MKYSVTITKNLIFIGCRLFTISRIKKINKKEADKLGLPKKYYSSYKAMILAAHKLIK